MVQFNTIFNFSKLRKGKFKNAPFLALEDGETSGGRKGVTHEYPNSDRRFREDLGLLRKTHRLPIYADTRLNFNERDILITALDSKGIGELIHPFYGQKAVSVIGWTSVNNFGLTKFDVTFVESDPSFLPRTDKGNKSLLGKLKDQIKSLQETKVGQTFSAINRGIKVFTRGVNKVNDFTEQMVEVSNSVLNVTSSVGSLQNTLNNTLDNTALLIKTPSELASRISNIFTQFELIGERVIDQFNATKDLFGFGSDDAQTSGATYNERLIDSNNNVLNTAIRSNAIAIGYTLVPDIDFDNDEQLETTKKILEDEYQELRLIVDDDTLDLLKQMRAQAQIVFDRLLKTVPKIYTVSLNSYQNLHQIVFKYYGNFANAEEYEEKLDQIWTLNSFTNPSKIRGEIKLLT